jgi:Oxygenase domain of the 2OGFeDO superfamily
VQNAPQVSANFRSQHALDWLDQISESNAILSAILAVIHPDLYRAGEETLKRLRQCAEIQGQDVLGKWTSIFSGVSVISNGTIRAHRDGQSRYQWYDLLTTLGSYRNCTLELPGLGKRLEYDPGTVVGISGMVLQHQVPSFDGERVSYAYFMRDSVHEWAKVPSGSWMKTDHYN